jgi:hypothetical protein
MNSPSKQASVAGLLIALGIIYGDIGTSSLYTLQTILTEGGNANEGLVFGSISCIFWTLTLQTTFKYVIITLQADNHGEGGVFSLYALAGTLADGFTFTSPAGDDHISEATFKERCFPTSKFTKNVSFLKMVESGNQVFLLVEINTTDNKLVRNMDIFTFNNAGKIQAYECFFGAGIGYPGHNSN